MNRLEKVEFSHDWYHEFDSGVCISLTYHYHFRNGARRVARVITTQDHDLGRQGLVARAVVHVV